MSKEECNSYGGGSSLQKRECIKLIGCGRGGEFDEWQEDKQSYYND